MTKKVLSTYEREIKNSKFRKAFERSYKELLLSELLTVIMENDAKSVRKLAKEVGLSPTVIQKLRAGKQSDIKVSNFINIVGIFGYKVILEKGDERILVEDEHHHNKRHLNFAFAI